MSNWKPAVITIGVLLMINASVFAHKTGEKVHVTVLNVQEGTAQGAQGYYTPTRITLQMPDGTTVIGSCVYMWGLKQYHPCAYPVAEADAEVKDNSVELFWSASLDDKKVKSEKYKIVQVIKPQGK